MSYITIKEVMERTHMKYSTIISWVNQGVLPARKIMNGKKSKYLFVWAEVEKRIENSKLAII